jgi:hypothetical protein
MPVYQIMDDMPYEEVQGWFKFFKERPIGWREDFRTAQIMRSNGVEKQPYELFESLDTIHKGLQSRKSLVPMSFVHFLKVKSVGGDEWNPTVD